MPHRFYRVRKIDQSTNSPLSISILQPTNTTVFGDITVEVSVNNTNPVGLVRLFVDGQPVNYEFGLDTVEFSINTTEWTNGPHIIHATAELLSESGTTGSPGGPQPETPAVGSSAPLTLQFDNLIYDFTVLNPYFDPYNPFFPEVQIVYAALSEPCNWTVVVVDDNDIPVMGYTNAWAFIYIEWDGTDFFGTPLPPGFYDYILTATKQSGSSLMSGSGSSGGEGAMRLVSSPQLIADPAERAKRINEINQTRKTGTADLMRSAVGIPDIGHAELQKHRPSGIRVPWFMRPKPSDSAAEFDPNKVVIPPIPPLIKPKITPSDWEKRVEAYLVMSNNIVANAYEAAAKRALAYAERLAEKVNTPIAPIASESGSDPQSLYAQAAQSTRDPRREDGRTQMSWIGGVGAMSQGHHPPTTSAPWSYGGLVKANVLAKYFVDQMAKGSKTTKFSGWKNTFHLTDDKVLKTNLVGTGRSGGSIITSNSWFNSRANIGILVGHTLEINPPGWPAGTWCPLAAYPLYNTANPGGYTWVPDGEMKFGSQYLKWMAYYGCNALTHARWYGGARDRFIWPLNPRLNVYLATGSTIYMYDEMGRLWAKGLQGEFDGVPMTLINAWKEAGKRAHTAENQYRQASGKPLIAHPVIMSWLYWNVTGGGDNSATDRLQPLTIASTFGRSIEHLVFDQAVLDIAP